MTISNTKAKSVYETNGERREWEIGFDFDSNVSKLNIILEDSEGYQTVVEDNYLIEDGVVIYPSLESELDPIEEGYKIILFRSTPNTQEIDLRDNVTEKGLDKLTLQVQELSEQVDRAVKVPLVEEGVKEYQDLVLKVREERDTALEQIKEATSVVSDYTQASALNAVISKEEAERAVEASNVSVMASSDAEAFATKAENLANEAHNAVSAYVNGLGAMRNAVLDLGVFEDNQRRASSSIIDFDFEPLDVFVRFSDSEKKMWIKGSNSFAGIEKVGDKKYKIFYSISSEDFSSQSAIKGPFHVQYVIKYSIFSGKPVVYRGRVDSVDQLPENAEDGDLWYVGPVEQDNKEEYVWQGGKWELLGSTDFTNIYTKEEIDNKVKVIEADIDANADAIQKTRSDFMESDSELQQQINAHATEITTLKNDIDELGDQVAGIESKIPEGTSDTNHLVNKQQLSDAIQSGVSVPDNVYTEDNLVPGENVVFEQEEEKINGEVLGSLNITSDFVASGFSDDNVIIANDPINETSNLQSFEICTSFKLYSTTNCGIIDTAGSAGNARWRITLDGGVIRARTMFYASTVGDVDIYGTTYVQPGVKYKLKYAYLADTNNGMYGYRLWVLPEGEEFRPDNTQGVNLYVERPYVSTTHNTIRLGDNSADGNAMDGEIYLGDTYINVNGERAWEAVTKGGKTKVSVNGAYTINNFLAGKDIEIIPEPVEGGIDDVTVACWHFDGRVEDEVSAFVPDAFYSDFLVTSTSKFGSGCYDIKYASTVATFNEFDSFAVDFWYKHVSEYQTASVGINCDNYGSTTSPTNGYRLKITGTQIGFQHSKYHENNSDSEFVDFPMYSSGIWHHIVVQRIGASILQLFVDGVMLLQKTMDLSLQRSNNVVFYGAGQYFDEIRVSHTSRYNENFTPPTQPYRKAVPTGNYVINYTGEAGEAGGSGKNIGEVYYSQSSLATDNAGALPLFTGETIASANTIYPDFYAWVESHAELQTTAEEYESALATYGECAKYVVSDGSLRLPKLANYIKMANTAEGITQSEAGLPNITGQTNFAPNAGMRNDAQPRGAFYKATATGHILDFPQGSGNDLGFDASLSSEVYGKSDTVTPAHTTLYPWVFAYNATVPASTAQAAEFQEGLSGKADADLDNTIPSKTFRENVFNWGLPDLTSGVTKSWNTDITAETNGWVNVKSYTIQGGTASCLIINGVEVYKLWCGFDAQVGYQNMWPVYKGDVYKATGGNSGQTITFYPCKGEVL